VSLKKIPDEDWQRVASEYGCAALRICTPDLGYGKWSARQVLAKASGQAVTESGLPEEKPKPSPATVKRMLGIERRAILVRGHDDLMVYRSKCCNPIPGDDIIGYVTRGRGIAVHSKRCPNVRICFTKPSGASPSNGPDATQATFPVRLRIFTEDRPGMLAGITSVISDNGANIRTFESGGKTTLRARIEVALDVRDRKQLEADPLRHQAHSRRIRYRARLQRLACALHGAVPARFPNA
jgi:GTP diphosphokinase / guanosine-3',5'-bis(diphosphate) 3'-diphosphatase